MRAILEICCGLDVHRDTIVATIMKGPLDCEPTSETRTFPAFQDDLKKLRTWLEKENCRHIAMESTGVYWKPIYSILEDSFDGDVDVLLVNAQNVKNVPGRKTDVKDSEWIARLLRAGLLSGSFIPDKDIRELRELTRYRKNMVHEVSSQKNRIEKFLQSNGFKLSTFMADVFGVTGKLIIGHLIQHGKLNIQELDGLVKGTLRNKKNEIALAVNGELNSHGRNFLSMQVKHLKQLEENVDEVNKSIDDHLKKYEQQAALIETMTGISKVSSAAIIAEIGVDMKHFANAQKICSWAGVSPGCNESAGKRKNTRTRHGNPYIKEILCEVAWVMTRRKESYLANWYWKVKQRRGAKKAIIGLARKILIIVYTMLKENVVYNEEIFKDNQVRLSEKREKKIILELQKRGYCISLEAV